MRASPALVLDRHWNILMANVATSRLVDLLLGPPVVAAPGPPNAMRLMFDPQGFRPHIVNWEAAAARHHPAGAPDRVVLPRRRGHGSAARRLAGG